METLRPKPVEVVGEDAPAGSLSPQKASSNSHETMTATQTVPRDGGDGSSRSIASDNGMDVVMERRSLEPELQSADQSNSTGSDHAGNGDAWNGCGVGARRSHEEMESAGSIDAKGDAMWDKDEVPAACEPNQGSIKRLKVKGGSVVKGRGGAILKKPKQKRDKATPPLSTAPNGAAPHLKEEPLAETEEAAVATAAGSSASLRDLSNLNGTVVPSGEDNDAANGYEKSAERSGAKHPVGLPGSGGGGRKRPSAAGKGKAPIGKGKMPATKGKRPRGKGPPGGGNVDDDGDGGHAGARVGGVGVDDDEVRGRQDCTSVEFLYAGVFYDRPPLRAWLVHEMPATLPPASFLPQPLMDAACSFTRNAHIIWQFSGIPAALRVSRTLPPPCTAVTQHPAVQNFWKCLGRMLPGTFKMGNLRIRLTAPLNGPLSFLLDQINDSHTIFDFVSPMSQSVFSFPMGSLERS